MEDILEEVEGVQVVKVDKHHHKVETQGTCLEQHTPLLVRQEGVHVGARKHS